MPRTPEQNEVIRAKRRRKLLKISLERFAALGYDDLVIDDITREAGCSHGLFYHYFSDKKIVFAALDREFFIEGEGAPPVEAIQNAHGLDGLKIYAHYLDAVQNRYTDYAYIAKVILNLDEAKTVDRNLNCYKIATSLKPALLAQIKTGQAEGDVIPGDPKEILQALLYLSEIILEKRINKEKAAPIGEGVITSLFATH